MRPHPSQFGGDLQRLVAVGADRERDDHRRGDPGLVLDQGGQQLQEAWGFGSGVGVEQFLGLIHRQHQGRGGLRLRPRRAAWRGRPGEPPPASRAPAPRARWRQAVLISPNSGRRSRARYAADGSPALGRIRRSAPPSPGARWAGGGSGGRPGAAAAATRPAETTTSPPRTGRG